MGVCAAVRLRDGINDLSVIHAAAGDVPDAMSQWTPAFGSPRSGYHLNPKSEPLVSHHRSRT
jgi:hypothetical protein